MLSALISSELSYPAMPLTGQPVHQRFVNSGPLVLGIEPLSFPAPTEDRGLLSLRYLLSVERRQFHILPPDHLGLLSYLLDL